INTPFVVNADRLTEKGISCSLKEHLPVEVFSSWALDTGEITSCLWFKALAHKNHPSLNE
ncbi:MAG: hypothetical protein WBL73_07905, partial [bacterium]